jgi:hypothetical protein
MTWINKFVSFYQWIDAETSPAWQKKQTNNNDPETISGLKVYRDDDSLLCHPELNKMLKQVRHDNSFFCHPELVSGSNLIWEGKLTLLNTPPKKDLKGRDAETSPGLKVHQYDIFTPL